MQEIKITVWLEGGSRANFKGEWRETSVFNYKAFKRKYLKMYLMI